MAKFTEKSSEDFLIDDILFDITLLSILATDFTFFMLINDPTTFKFVLNF